MEAGAFAKGCSHYGGLGNRETGTMGLAIAFTGPFLVL